MGRFEKWRGGGGWKDVGVATRMSGGVKGMRDGWRVVSEGVEKWKDVVVMAYGSGVLQTSLVSP